MTDVQQPAPLAQKQAQFINDLIITPVSDPNAGAKNGAELIRAKAAARKILAARLTPIEGVAARADGIKACIALCERMEADKSLPAEAGNAAWNLKVGMRHLLTQVSPATSPAIPEGTSGDGVEKRDDIRRSIIRQLGFDPHADRIILAGTDWDIVLEALRSDATQTREAEGPRLMSDEAKTGERVLVHFTGKGWLTVTWEDPHGDGSYSIWTVDDDKHGPYALRGYNEGDDTHWMPLSALPVLAEDAA